MPIAAHISSKRRILNGVFKQKNFKRGNIKKMYCGYRLSPSLFIVAIRCRIQSPTLSVAHNLWSYGVDDNSAQNQERQCTGRAKLTIEISHFLSVGSDAKSDIIFLSQQQAKFIMPTSTQLATFQKR